MKNEIKKVTLLTLLLSFITVIFIFINNRSTTPQITTPTYTTPVENPSQVLNNVSLNKPIIAERGQVVYKDYHINLTSKNITDGDFTTGWRTQTDINGQNRAQAIIDLQYFFTINQATVKFGWDRKDQFDNLVSLRLSSTNSENPTLENNSIWKEISTFTYKKSQSGKVTSQLLPPTNTRFVKVEYLRDDDQWAGWGNIYEIILHGI